MPKNLVRARQKEKEWRQKNPGKQQIYQRRWINKNREKVHKYQRNLMLKKKYGITLTEYEKILDSQGGKCALCSRGPGTRSLHVDHCHKTGRIRGLLCAPCNRAVGVLGDSAEALERVVKYLSAQ